MPVSINIPAGDWALAVSGHADSVALLRLAVAAAGAVRVVVVHLDHELRGDASAGDAEFVSTLAGRLGVRCEMMRLGHLGVRPLANKAATYRAARHEAYRRTVVKHQAQGVLLAHHADDQTETVALRLLRGVLPPARMGMLPEAIVDGLRLVRPVLSYRKQQLTDYLAAIGQGHRVDGTNDRPDQARNVVRSFLLGRDDLCDALLALHVTNEDYRIEVGSQVPDLAAALSTRLLADLPDPVARAAAGSWLTDRGADSEYLSRQVLDRLVAMCRDAATPARQMFPGRVTVSRKKGQLMAVQAE